MPWALAFSRGGRLRRAAVPREARTSRCSSPAAGAGLRPTRGHLPAPRGLRAHPRDRNGRQVPSSRDSGPSDARSTETFCPRVGLTSEAGDISGLASLVRAPRPPSLASPPSCPSQRKVNPFALPPPRSLVCSSLKGVRKCGSLGRGPAEGQVLLPGVAAPESPGSQLGSLGHFPQLARPLAALRRIHLAPGGVEGTFGENWAFGKKLGKWARFWWAGRLLLCGKVIDPTGMASWGYMLVTSDLPQTDIPGTPDLKRRAKDPTISGSPISLPAPCPQLHLNTHTHTPISFTHPQDLPTHS